MREAPIQINDLKMPINADRRRFAIYQQMRASHIEWVNDIPSHWEIKRLKFIVSEPLKYGANEAAELDDPDLPRYIRITDVDDEGRLRVDTFKSIPEEAALPYLLKEGDLSLARSGATASKSFFYKGSWGRAAYAGYLIRARFDANKALPSFVNYYTNSHQYWQWLSSIFVQATIQNVSAEKYANLQIPVPPLDEQRAIAAFLDRETAKIDTLVAKKLRLIELLKEKRTALISHAVTKGLKPDAHMKPSGINWLGEVPAHWEVKRLKFVAQLLNGFAFDSNFYVSDGVPIIRIGDVSETIDWYQVKRVPTEFIKTLLRFRIYRGDILIALTGATIGKSATFNYDEPTLLNQRVGMIRSKNAFQPFLAFVFRSSFVSGFIEMLCYGGAQENIGKNDVGDLTLCVPPLSEQIEITEFLENHIAKLDKMVAKVEHVIEKLNEYRSALISAAVTGKIDVRELAKETKSK